MLSSIIFAQLLLTGTDAFSIRAVISCKNAPRSLQSLANVDGRHSFVEGENFADRSAELEALGGDPFFLDDDSVIDVDAGDESGSEEDEEMAMPSSLLAGMAMASGGGVMDVIGKQEKRYATDGKGPIPKPPPPPRPDDWEWDGIVDENAHLDDF